MARICKAPATIFIVVGCFPIVPGKGIYQTMLYLISHDQDLFLDSLFQTVGTALALCYCNFNCFKLSLKLLKPLNKRTIIYENIRIIVEYNPFHTGHLYHLQKAKEMVKPDLNNCYYVW